MADNKLMNRYYPPDFDPSKLLPVKAIRPRSTAGPKSMSIRMMLPFTMRCDHCGEYLYIATKFNSRCSKAGTTPLGLNAYRFHGKCKHCSGEFVFRTDPESSDYVLESGGTRSYEAMKDADFAEAEAAKARADAEGVDDSVALENKIYDTAAEMRRIEELGDLRAINKREAKRNDAIDAAIKNITKELDGENFDDQDTEEFERLKKVKETVEKEPFVSLSKPPSKPSSNSFSSLGIRVKPKPKVG